MNMAVGAGIQLLFYLSSNKPSHFSLSKHTAYQKYFQTMNQTANTHSSYIFSPADIPLYLNSLQAQKVRLGTRCSSGVIWTGKAPEIPQTNKL
jgi:hypothetical protein